MAVMKKLEKKVVAPVAAPAAPRQNLMSGTKATVDTLQHATARLSFRRVRDILPGKIESSRLILRAPMRGDVPVLVALADNKNIAERLSRLPSPYTRADGIAFIEIFAQRADERPYAITTHAGEFLGIVGFSYAMGQHPELGYWLGEPHWGKGYMTEAVKALLETAFATGLYPVVRARALRTNEGSIHVLEKAGFKNVGKGTMDRVGTGKGQPIFEFRREQPR
jgi:RimJ/RimL family protein N-acetyltransferase